MPVLLVLLLLDACATLDFEGFPLELCLLADFLFFDLLEVLDPDELAIIEDVLGVGDVEGLGLEGVGALEVFGVVNILLVVA